jgi:exopolyphosphatase / guanosine-5'-triphosphate,3'-diphosphate pyrophosphatase
MPFMRVAAIDVGTNTIRLLIGEADGRGGYRPVLATQESTRLGQGLLPDRVLQPEPIGRSVAVLKRYRGIAADHKVSAIAAVGTSAVREARNQEGFLAQVRRDADLEISVISGEEEARLTLLGVRAALDPAPRRMLMLDIGGGSTELLLADGDAIVATVSTGLGVVKLTERFLTTDPPAPAELEGIRHAAVERLRRTSERELPDLASVAAFVGTAGTVTTLAAMDLALAPYDPSRVTGHQLTRERVAHWLHQLASLPLASRRHVRGLEPARADVIVAGAVVCLTALDILGFSALTVSDGGLREGILLDLLRPARPGQSGPAITASSRVKA